MPPKRVQRSRSRQTTPQSPPKQIPSNQSPQQARRGTRSRSHDINQSPIQQKRPEQPMPALNEEVDEEEDIEVIEVLQQNLPSEGDQGESAAGDQLESDDEISDTTSDGATQLEALDTDLLIDCLPSVYQNAAQILSLLHSNTAEQLVHDFSAPTSKVYRRLLNYARVLNASRQAFGNGSYIDIRLVLRKLTQGSSINEGPWRPDPILQLANLSLLLTNIVESSQTAIYDTLERMFNTFPEPFGNFHMTVGEIRYSTQLVTETVSFGIALRTQFFLRVVEQAKRDATFDPDSVLQSVFFHEDGKLSGFQSEDEEIPIETENAITKQLQQIRKHFKKSSTNPIDLKRLKQTFPWHQFLTEAFRWISLRKQELDAEIVAQGGVDSIRHRLEDADFAPYKEQTPYAVATPEAAEVADIRTLSLKDTSKQTPKQWQSPRQIATSSKRSEIAILKRRIEQEEENSDEDEEDEEGEEVDEDEDEEAGAVEEEEEEGNRESLEPKEPTVKPTHTQKRTPLKGPVKDLQATVAEIPQTPENAIADPDETRDVVDVDGVEDAGDNFVDGDDEVIEPESEPAPDPTPPMPTQGTIIPTQQTLAVLGVAKQQATMGNKENLDATRRSYLDKQPSAKRIEWDDSQTGHKRSRREVDRDDEEEEDEFETDSRPQKRARLPRPPAPDAADEWLAADGDDETGEQPPQSAQHSSRSARTTPKPPRATQPLPYRSPLQPLPVPSTFHLPSSSAPERRERLPSTHRSASSQHTSPPPSTQAEAHRTVNAQAKATIRMHNPHGQPTFRPPQVRRAWTIDETDRLFDMISVYGCAWAAIMDNDRGHPEGGKLQGRSQVQLKDKARNLKMDYLKAGAELPAGFSGVTIKSSDKDLLTSLGLPFEAP